MWFQILFSLSEYLYKDYTVPSFITTTVTDDGMASGPATLLQKLKHSAKNELPHIF